MPGERSVSFMSFNVQAGAGTQAPHRYITQGWRHVVPNRGSRANMRAIARIVREHDIIGLQEIDAGSWRSGGHNEIELLAQRAGFGFWHAQVNRDFGRLAQHGLGLLSRYRPDAITEHDLPGRIPGRGALVARFGSASSHCLVIVTHLSLGARSRTEQLRVLGDLIAPARHVVILADTNCSSRALARDPTLARYGLRCASPSLPSYPSWRPRRDIDHIISSRTLRSHSARVTNAPVSDHRPVWQRIDWPSDIPLVDTRARPSVETA